MQEILQWSKSRFTQYIKLAVFAFVLYSVSVLRVVGQLVLQLQCAHRDVADSVIDSERSGQGADVQTSEVCDIISEAVSV